MSYLLSFLFGTVLKIYDDLADNKLLKKFKTPLFVETIKMLNIIFFLVLSIQEPLFYYFLTFIFFSNIYSVPSSFEGAYEKAGIIILFVIYFFTDNSKIRFSNLDLTFLFMFCMMVGIIYIENIFSPTEFSVIKLFIRFWIFIYSFLSFLFLNNNNETICLFYTFVCGYMLVSLVVQYYSLFISNIKIKKQKNKKNKKNKKTKKQKNKKTKKSCAS
jgi:hypothetical protein